MSAELTDSELGWLAGIVDGEGHVAVARYRDGFCSVLKVGMTHRETVERVALLFERLTGVKARAWTPGSRNPLHADQWFVEVKDRGRVAVIARALLPFAVTRREQLLLAVEWFEHRERERRYDGTEIDFYERSRALNRRGPREVAAA